MGFDVIIIAGGKGTRMEEKLPKPLVNAKGKPILFHQIEYLYDGADKIILSLGHMANEIIKAVKKEFKDKKIIFSVEDKPLGTSGGLKKAFSLSSSDTIIALNCDDVTDIDVAKLAKLDGNYVCVSHPRLPFGLVTRDENGYARFVEKPILGGWVSCGWYKFERRFIENFPDNGMLEYDVFPKAKLKRYLHNGFWMSLNSKKDIAEFEKLKSWPSMKL